MKLLQINMKQIISTLLFLFFAPVVVFGNLAEKKKRIVFIINPISHEMKGLDVQKAIDEHLDLNQFEYKIVYTQCAQHATQLAYDALMDSADILAAVGGDGTVNEVGRALIHSEAILAIIPVGSGNGLARHLGIPIGFASGIQTLNCAQTAVVDTATINDKVFLGVAGIGFDAHIAQKFSLFEKRGFLSYFHLVVKEFFRYKPQSYLITIDGEQIARKAFILTFANNSQYGNDFVIAPKAQMRDGYLDLVIVDRIPPLSILPFLYRFKQGTLDHSRHCETRRFKEITIEHPSMQAHLDGEPSLFQNRMTVTVQPNSLKILVPHATTQ
jgi:YegS/Rv2252/BmrU family lipid kinase